MRFKIDENLPVEIANMLRAEGHDAMGVVEQDLGGQADPIIASICRSEGRILVTLDMDFADIRTYPPQEYAGMMVLRLRRQDRRAVSSAFRNAVSLLDSEPIHHRLWIVEERRVRIRE